MADENFNGKDSQKELQYGDPNQGKWGIPQLRHNEKKNARKPVLRRKSVQAPSPVSGFQESNQILRHWEQIDSGDPHEGGGGGRFEKETIREQWFIAGCCWAQKKF